MIKIAPYHAIAESLFLDLLILHRVIMDIFELKTRQIPNRFLNACEGTGGVLCVYSIVSKLIYKFILIMYFKTSYDCV